MGGDSNLCSAVSYFSTLLGSIIGAGRLSFRVRDGTGRFPAAVAAVTLFTFPVTPRGGGGANPGWVAAGPLGVPGVGCFWWGGVVLWFVVWLRGKSVSCNFFGLTFCSRHPFWGGGVVSFRPVSTSSLNTLRCV